MAYKMDGTEPIFEKKEIEEETETIKKIKKILEENECFTSISLRKLTLERFQNIKQKVENITGKKMSNDEMMNLILDLLRRKIEEK